MSKDQLKSRSNKQVLLLFFSNSFFLDCRLVLRDAFNVFDNEKKGAISLDIIGTILELLGHAVEEEELDDILDEFDEVE